MVRYQARKAKRKKHVKLIKTNAIMYISALSEHLKRFILEEHDHPARISVYG